MHCIPAITKVTSTAYWFLTLFPMLSGNLDIQHRVLYQRSAQVATIEKFLLEIVWLYFTGRFLPSASLYPSCPYGLARSVVGVHDLSASGPLIDRVLSCSLQRKAAVVCLACAKALCKDHCPEPRAWNWCFSSLLRSGRWESRVRATSAGCLSVWRVSILTPLLPNYKGVSNSLITFLEEKKNLLRWSYGWRSGCNFPR